jgi:sigma-B regulation protein RsbU (phosphoserine phosphatase)
VRYGDDRRLERLSRTGIPLGLFEDQSWEQGGATLGPGDTLVLYTDGVTDAQDARGVLFGEERFLASLRTNAGRSAGDIRSAILTDLDGFVGDAPQQDDIGLVIVVRDVT